MLRVVVRSEEHLGDGMGVLGEEQCSLISGQSVSSFGKGGVLWGMKPEPAISSIMIKAV